MRPVMLRDLVDGATDEWGDPKENIGHIVPFGQVLIDKSLIGVPVERGAIFQIQGIKGSRKTTVALNFVINQCLSGRLPQGYHIAYDTLESGMSIERIRDIIWAMVATKYLIYWHWHETEERDLTKLLSRGLPTRPVVSLVEDVGARERDTILRPEFFKYGMRTEKQKDAIQMAGNVIRNWPVYLFGASEHPDLEIRRARTVATWNLEQSVTRWSWLYEHKNVRQLVIDHINEYQFHDNPSDFDVQKRVIPALASWQKESLGIAWIIAQVGVGSAREARRDGVDMSAMGGFTGEAESSLTWTVEYDPDEPYYVKLKRPNKSRIGMHPDLSIKIEPNSGVFVGQATYWSERL